MKDIKDIKTSIELREAVQNWQKETFTEMDNVYSWMVKWYEEFKEVIEEHNKKSEQGIKEELADLLIVSYGVGICNEALGTYLENSILNDMSERNMKQLFHEVIRKLEKNMKREWKYIPQESIKIGIYKGSH